MEPGSGVLLIYDGECRFCRWSVAWIARLARPGTVDFCPFGDPVAQSYLARVPEERRYESMHLVAGKRIHSGTAAARMILRHLPFGHLAAGLRLHRMYPFIARYRGTLGRLSPDRSALTGCGGHREAEEGSSKGGPGF